MWYYYIRYIPRIHEYLCDSCDSSFPSSFLAQNHKKKSCIGVKHPKNPQNEKEIIEYKIRMGYPVEPEDFLFLERMECDRVSEFNECKKIK
jgi:hypothetical protein